MLVFKIPHIYGAHNILPYADMDYSILGGKKKKANLFHYQKSCQTKEIKMDLFYFELLNCNTYIDPYIDLHITTPTNMTIVIYIHTHTRSTHNHVYIYVYMYVCMYTHTHTHIYGERRVPCGVMVKVMDYGIVVSEFVLQSRYYVHFRANTLGKGMNPLILPAMG